MAAIAMSRTSPVRSIQKFARGPKGSLLIILALFAVIAAPAEGLSRVLSPVALAMLTAAVLDASLAYFIRGSWIFPDGALLTGLIIGLVQSPEVAPYVPPATAAIAIVSKYLIRTRWSNVFNPAALALVVSTILFGVGQSWWGSFPDLSPFALVALLAGGIFITNKLNKLPMVLVFTGAYFTLFTLASFLGDPARVAEIFRSPDLNAALFFALFMLDDPPTSPVKYEDQVWYGLIVAVVGFAVFESLGVVYFLLAGVLVGNAWESWRRFSAFADSRAARLEPR